jgi:arylsulfatase A-like enzyme
MEPNILLVVLDSVRASNLSLYGHVYQTSPFLSTVAMDFSVYTNARSPSIGSRPSHASLFTGHHAAETGISGGRRLKPDTTIWEELQDDGYDTAVFSDNPFLRSNRYGFIHGFETV